MQVHRQLDTLPNFNRAVVTIGSFDGVHLGHQKLLGRISKDAQAVGGESVVVTFDPHPRHVIKHNGPTLRLLNTLPEKIERIRNQGIDHLVVVPFTMKFASQTAEEYLQDFLFGKFAPHTIVIGYDHRFGAGRSGTIDLLSQVAATRDICVDEIKAKDIEAFAVSSTRIRQSVQEGKIELANRLLGSPYPLNGRIVRGQALGRTIGFPTANLDIDAPYKLLPADGVYAVRAQLHDEKVWRSAMLYIGERPSLQGKLPRSIEVNILDFSQNVYGQFLSVEVCKRLRGDRAFASLDELKAQISLDKQATVEYFSQL